MKHWPGMPIQTVSTVTAAQTVKVDRAAVRVYQTLYGEICYIVEAAKLGGVQWYPVSEEYDDPHAALARCREIEKQIEEARKQDEMVSKKARRDSNGCE